MSKLLYIENLKKSYGKSSNKTNALTNVSFEVKKGEFIGIIGHSGCGKTTLLNIISTIDSATSGKVLIDGIDIGELSEKKCSIFRKENLGFIFQDFKLIDNLTAEENIALPLLFNGIKPQIVKEKIDNLAKVVSIVDLLDKYPYQLSGGQKQRVACCRAIITEPTIILADEPTGALDSENSTILMKLLKKINIEIGSTILLVTHDMNVASNCNRVILMKDGQIISELKNDYYKDSENDKFMQLILNETMNKVELSGGE